MERRQRRVPAGAPEPPVAEDGSHVRSRCHLTEGVLKTMFATRVMMVTALIAGFTWVSAGPGVSVVYAQIEQRPDLRSQIRSNPATSLVLSPPQDNRAQARAVLEEAETALLHPRATRANNTLQVWGVT